MSGFLPDAWISALIGGALGAIGGGIGKVILHIISKFSQKFRGLVTNSNVSTVIIVVFVSIGIVVGIYYVPIRTLSLKEFLNAGYNYSETPLRNGVIYIYTLPNKSSFNLSALRGQIRVKLNEHWEYEGVFDDFDTAKVKLEQGQGCFSYPENLWTVDDDKPHG